MESSSHAQVQPSPSYLPSALDQRSGFRSLFEGMSKKLETLEANRWNSSKNSERYSSRLNVLRRKRALKER